MVANVAEATRHCDVEVNGLLLRLFSRPGYRLVEVRFSNRYGGYPLAALIGNADSAQPRVVAYRLSEDWMRFPGHCQALLGVARAWWREVNAPVNSSSGVSGKGL